ncbi:diacylglycerol kinase family protein [Salicibibacter cibarius]|uniref:Diacylglycerol kinase family protein n=1 Tax=Salicibibacter cibarius TaxID=2743000 RepID=A0A7T7CBD6_9BACI|nr:diacylglycerol kinase family protein [Salicibibacter cibarius]QQK75827.1 diacylglycerol kinase family protein [Salicibibacter cibarius]
MDWREKRKQKGVRRLFFSFVFASRGLWYVLKNEQNMVIHMAIASAILVLGFVFGISPIEWAILLVVIGGVITFELVNTAIERVVDLVSEDYHPLAKIAKDVAATAVFVYSLIAVVVGIIIFYQPLLELLGIK